MSWRLESQRHSLARKGIKTSMAVKGIKKGRKKTNLSSGLTKEQEIDNFIIYWTSDEKEREQMRLALKDYLEAEEKEG